MRKRSRNVIATVLAIGLLAAIGASISAAEVAPRDVAATASVDPAVMHDEGDFAPVAVKEVLAVAFGEESAACLSKDAVVEGFAADEAEYGGKTYILADGLDQAFADAWRRQAAADAVRVSSIVAHLFADRSGAEWTADVVEIDRNGCAMSRTLLPGDVWSGLLRSALGVEV